MFHHQSGPLAGHAHLRGGHKDGRGNTLHLLTLTCSLLPQLSSLFLITFLFLPTYSSLFPTTLPRTFLYLPLLFSSSFDLLQCQLHARHLLASIPRAFLYLPLLFSSPFDPLRCQLHARYSLASISPSPTPSNHFCYKCIL